MATIISIQDPSDPRVEPYLHVRERDLVGRRGLFVAEGKVVIEKLLGSRHYAPDSILIAEHRIGSAAALLERVPSDTPVYAVPQAVMDLIAGFPLHRGLLAIGRRRQVAEAEGLLAGLPRQATILLLSAIANHDNMGGIFRNAAAFAADAVLLDSDCCDPLYRKSIRVSVGAAMLVPWARLSAGEDGIAIARRHDFDCVGLTPSGDQRLTDYSAAQRTALILGAEGPGLSAEDLGRVRRIRIDMAADFDSLNVATTSGIALHHIMATKPPRLD